MTLSDKLYKILIQGGSWKTILGGLWGLIQISFFALLLGTRYSSGSRQDGANLSVAATRSQFFRTAFGPPLQHLTRQYEGDAEL